MANLNLESRTKYGLSWPKQVPDHQIEMYMAKKWREPEYAGASFLNPVSEHMLRALRLLFTPKQLVIHPWFEEMAESWVNDSFSVWWGAASCGKSHAAGVFALIDYLTDPQHTYTVLASTTKDMLAVRSFASVVEYLGHLKANGKLYVPFKYNRAATMIVPEDAPDDEAAALNLKAVIKGVAVAMGTEQEATAKLQGVHLPYVRMIGDELEGMRPAFAKARMNLMVAEKHFKFLGMCNPESLTGEAGRLSVPKDPTGWLSIDPDTTTRWESQLGTVYRFDALKSPGLKNPELYPFLPSARTNSEVIRQNHGNMDAPAVWTYLRGFPPPMSTERTVISEAELVAHRMKEPVVWRDQFTTVAAIDPAFTSDGDNAVFQVAYVGYSATGIMTLAYGPTHYLQILASSKKPVLEQLVEQSVFLLEEYGIPQEHVAVDDSGTQSVADALEMARGVGLQRFNFSAKPPQLPVSVVNYALCSDKYRNVTTWLHYTLAEYARFGQIRQLPDKAAEQLCKRRVLPKQKPLQIEGKTDVKKRTRGASPDEADAVVLVAGLVRVRLAMSPGSTELSQTPYIPYTGTTGYDMQEAVSRYNNLGSSYLTGGY